MKSKRHNRILEIINKKEIETQEELAEELKKSGFEVTQATISRDIKILKLLKVQSISGKYRYVAPTKEERNINEDSYYISESLDEVQLYIIADGMGGYNGGEIASSLAIKSAKNYIENNFAQADKDKESIIQLVASSLEYANMVVYEKSKENKELNGMGTTLDICLIYNNKAYIGHVGDSRIYRIRKDFIRKLTQDHSYVQKLVKDGKITEEEAAHHPQKNMLMKALRM